MYDLMFPLIFTQQIKMKLVVKEQGQSIMIPTGQQSMLFHDSWYFVSYFELSCKKINSFWHETMTVKSSKIRQLPLLNELSAVQARISRRAISNRYKLTAQLLV